MKQSTKTKLPHRFALAILLSGLSLSGCTAEALKRTAYEALHRKGCMDRTGVPDCNREHADYDEYTRERQKILNAGR